MEDCNSNANQSGYHNSADLHEWLERTLYHIRLEGHSKSSIFIIHSGQKQIIEYGDIMSNSDSPELENGWNCSQRLCSDHFSGILIILRYFTSSQFFAVWLTPFYLLWGPAYQQGISGLKHIRHSYFSYRDNETSLSCSPRLRESTPRKQRPRICLPLSCLAQFFLPNAVATIPSSGLSRKHYSNTFCTSGIWQLFSTKSRRPHSNVLRFPP